MTQKNLSLQKPPRNLFFDFLKGVCILSVSIGHALQTTIPPNDNESFFENPLFISIYMWHMPLFAIISGYFAYSSIQKSNSFFSFIWNKFLHLWVPSVTVGVFYILTSKSLLVDNEYHQTILALIRNCFTGSLWFLSAIFKCLLVSFLINKYISNTKIRFFSYLTIILLLPTLYFFIHFSVGAWFIFLIPFFYGGILFKEYGFKIEFLTNKLVFLVPISIAIFIFCYLIWSTPCYIYKTPFLPTPPLDNALKITFFSSLRLVIGFLTSFCIVVFSYCFYLFLKKYNANAILNTTAKCGLASLQIYALQGPILKIITLIFGDINFERWGFDQSITWSSFLTGAILTAICYWTYKLLKQIPFISTVLFGEIKK